MIESEFTRKVNSKLNPNEVFSWKINDNFQGGVPDAWYLPIGTIKGVPSSAKSPLFVEYKYLKALPKRETTVIIPALTIQQLDWLRMLVDNGHRAIVIVGAPLGRSSKGAIFTSEEWEDGITYTEFVTRALDYVQLADAIKNRVFGIASN